MDLPGVHGFHYFSSCGLFITFFFPITRGWKKVMYCRSLRRRCVLRVRNLPGLGQSQPPAIIILTYLLTPWSRILLGKLTGLQLVKEFPAFYGTRRFINAFTSARYVSLSWASSIKSIPKHPTSRRSIFILYSIYAWVSPVVSFPQLSSPKPRSRLSPPPHAPRAPPVSFFSILSPAQYWMRNTDH